MSRLLFILLFGFANLSCSKVDENKQTEITEAEPLAVVENIADNESEIKTPPWRKNTSPPNHYGESWHLSWGWKGEYPNGFSVLEDNVVLKARVSPNPKLEKSLACSVDYLGMYHQWNPKRNHEISFITASRIIELEIDNVSTAEFYEDENLTSRTFFSGEKITYLTYLSEGWALVEIDGKKTELSIVDLSLKDPSGYRHAEEQWMGIPCNEFIGWITYKDAIKRDDIAEYGLSLSSWGYTEDISLADTLKLQKQITQNRAE